MAWPSRRFKTATPGGAWTPDDMNGWQDQFIRPNGLVADDLNPQLAADLGLNVTGTTRRGVVTDADERVETGSPVAGSTLTLATTPGGLLLAYGEAEIKLPTAGSAVLRLYAGQTVAYERAVAASTSYRPYRLSDYFVPLHAPGGSMTVRLEVSSTTSTTVSAQNMKLWGIAFSF